MSNYPKELNGQIVWACCVSIIDAGNCNHLRARDGRPLRGDQIAEEAEQQLKDLLMLGLSLGF